MSDAYQALIDSLRDHQNGGRRNECEEAARAIETIRAELTEARRQLKEASEQEPVGCMSPEQFSILTGDPVDNGVHVRIWQVYNPPSRAKSGVKLYAAPVPQPASVNGSTHCDSCGCDWLDNGLNPIGCPYCKRNDDKFNPCINSLVRQVALMMEDCEEHADGTITSDCDISQGFLRRIYDLLSALNDCGYDAIEPQPAVSQSDIVRVYVGESPMPEEAPPPDGVTLFARVDSLQPAVPEGYAVLKISDLESLTYSFDGRERMRALLATTKTGDKP